MLQSGLADQRGAERGAEPGVGALGPQSLLQDSRQRRKQCRYQSRPSHSTFGCFNSGNGAETQRKRFIFVADKVELTSNGVENSRWAVARHPPAPSSPSGRSPAASSSGSSPSPGQDALGLAAPAEPSSTATATAGAEQTSGGNSSSSSATTTESGTESLPAG